MKANRPFHHIRFKVLKTTVAYLLPLFLLNQSLVQAATTVSYTGGSYTQDFNSLPYTSGTSVNTNNPVTLGGVTYTLPSGANATYDFGASTASNGLGLSSTMSGWYGGAQTANFLGASAGDQTKGGVISFGALTGSNRALGLSSTSTSGLTTFGVEIVNNTGATLNQIDLQFTEELWRQQTTQQVMNMGYTISSSPSAAMPLTGTTSLGSFSFATGTATSGAQSAPISTASYNASGTSASVGNWAPGTALWITWQTSQSSGGSQELAIDNLSFSASLGASTPTWNNTSGTWTVGTGTNWTGGTGTVFNNGDNVTSNNTSGGTVTVDAGVVAPGSTTVNSASGTYTFTGGSIGGTGALTKSGGGTLVLASSNSYSGGTSINGGILSTGSDAALGNTSGGISFGGGTLQTSAGISSARAINMSGAGTVDTNGFNSTLSGNITGTGALTKAGAGALTLSGTNTYAGGTTLAAGALNNNGSLTLGGGSVAVAVTGSATLTNNGTINQTGTGRAIRDNTGGLSLTVNNGSSTNSTALMQTADADVIQMNKANSNVTLNNYGTMTSLNASAGGSQAVDFNAITTGSNTINNYAGAVMQSTEADAVRPGVNGFVNNDGLIKSTTTTGSSSDGIDAQANTGITIVNAASAGSGTGTGTIEGARHGITGGNTAVDNVGNPTVNNGAYTMSITNNLGGTIQGDNGSGINIDGLNKNEVVTVINHGTITGNGHDIGDSAAHDGDGVDIDGVVNITNTGTIKSINAFGGAPVSGVQGIENSEGITVGGGTITNSGLIQGSVTAGNTTAIGRGITIAGVDKLITFDGTTTTETPIPVQAPYAATTITNQAGGQIIGDSDSAIIFSSALASGFSHTINNQAGATIQTGSTSAPAILTAADYVTINNAGTINGSSSGKAITMGTAGGAVHITGGSAIVNGNVDGGNASVSSASFDPGAGNSFSYSGALSNFHDVTISTGNVMLSGASTYSGNTTVNGTLSVTNAIGSATGSGSVMVNSGGFLNGTGSIGGDVSLASGATLSPGLSSGTLGIGGNLDLVSGAHIDYALGITPNQINIGGVLNYTGGGTAIFDIFNNGLTSGSDYTLMNYSSENGLSLSNLAFGSTPAGFVGEFTIGANSLTLHVDSVPEPSRALLGGLGLAFLVLRRRRRALHQAGV